MATVFEAGTATCYAAAKGVRTLTPAGRNPDLDITFNCLGMGNDGDLNQGVAFSFAEVTGGLGFVDFDATATSYADVSGTPVWGNVFSGTATSYAQVYGDLLLEGPKKNWVAWAKPGTVDFTVDNSNEAGEGPLLQNGYVNGLKRLGNNVIAYGANGIFKLTVNDVFWNLKDQIYPVGVMNKTSVAGSDDFHFFLDRHGKLVSVGNDGITVLDFSEFLSVMSSAVLTWDAMNKILYICDGTRGYVYVPNTNALGSGPATVCGIGYRDGTSYLVAPGAITSTALSIITDIYDHGTRRNKTIYSLDFGTNISGTLQAAIEYSTKIGGSFTSTGWKTVSDSGRVFFGCRGREFKYKWKLLVYEYCEIDVITSNGVYHVH